LAQQLLFWHIYFKNKFNLCGVFNAEIMKNCLSKKFRFVDTSANVEGILVEKTSQKTAAGLRTCAAKSTHVRGKNSARARQKLHTCAAKTPHVRGGGG
jgi:hypothetical protein